MKYLVMECHTSYAVLLDEEGRFVNAANLHYEVGQTVEEPVLMRDESVAGGVQTEGAELIPMRSGERNSRRRIWRLGSVAAVAACFLMVFGIGYYQQYLAVHASILMTINPKVEISLNRRGTVVKLSGANEDGAELLEGYTGKGKDKVTVADELIDRAIEMGFLSAGGQVSFVIDTPKEAEFQEYGLELRSGVTEHLRGRVEVEIEIRQQGGAGTEADEQEKEQDKSDSAAGENGMDKATGAGEQAKPAVQIQVPVSVPGETVQRKPGDAMWDDDGEDDEDDDGDDEDDADEHAEDDEDDIEDDADGRETDDVDEHTEDDKNDDRVDDEHEGGDDRDGRADDDGDMNDDSEDDSDTDDDSDDGDSGDSEEDSEDLDDGEENDD